MSTVTLRPLTFAMTVLLVGGVGTSDVVCGGAQAHHCATTTTPSMPRSASNAEDWLTTAASVDAASAAIAAASSFVVIKLADLIAHAYKSTAAKLRSVDLGGMRSVGRVAVSQ